MDETKPRRSVCPKATNPTPATLSGQWLQSCYQQFALMGRVNCCSRWSVTLWHTVVKVKVKVTLVQATKYQRGSRGIALLFLYHGTRSVWVVSLTPRPILPTGKTQYRRLGGPQGQSGQRRKFSPRPEFVPPTVGIKTKSHPNETPLQAASSSIYMRHMLPSTWHKSNI